MGSARYGVRAAGAANGTETAAEKPPEGCEVRVEEAGATQIDQLVAWRETVLREVFDLGPDADLTELIEQNRRYYEHQIPVGGHVACFARRDGRTVGCGGVCLTEELPSPDNPSGRCAYLMNIYTLPSERGTHVGRAVVEWLVDRARAWGAGKIYLESSEDGKRLYPQLGFTEMRDMYRLG